MISYRDMTFCSANCAMVDCHRNKAQLEDNPHLDAWAKIVGGRYIAWSDFSERCPLYVPDQPPADSETADD